MLKIVSDPEAKLKRIEAAIRNCSDRGKIETLNAAWWAEYFRIKDEKEKLVCAAEVRLDAS